MTIKPEFVDHIPDQLEDGTLYISMRFSTAIHNCCCGCGSQTVTPLSYKDWRLTIDGEFVSIEPSIGNYQIPCKSHYWIKNNQVVWA